MNRLQEEAVGVDAARALVEEMLRTGFVLIDLISSLIEELPADAFPGEESGAVLIEMVAGSCLPALQAAGERECREAATLIAAVRDRVLDDLRLAAELAKPEAAAG